MFDLDATLVPTRLGLHALAEHVLSAARHAATGRIGLVPSPGGFATPPFPSEHGQRTIAVEVLSLVVSDDRGVRRQHITTLREAAALAELEPGAPVDVFTPSTPLDLDAPLEVHAGASEALGAWFALGQQVLDALRAELTSHDPSEIQLWPEHFDLAFSAAEVNWGVSPGDDACSEPYLYVGPWAAPAPDGDFWNAPFGAQRRVSALRSAAGVPAFFEDARRRLGL